MSLEFCFHVSCEKKIPVTPGVTDSPAFEVLHPSEHLCGPPVDPVQHIFAMLRAPELDSAIQVRTHLSVCKSYTLLAIYNEKRHDFFPSQFTCNH